jgi:HlyD family type I secretion membrane fusion protein
VRRARLEAQLQLRSDFRPPALPGVDQQLVIEASAREGRILRARHELLMQQQRTYRDQLEALRAEQAGLMRQIESTRRSVQLAREELEIHRKLLSEQYVARARVIALERALAELEASVAEQEASWMQAEQRRTEAKQRLAAAPQEYQRAAAEELRDTEARLLQLAAQLRPAEDAARRQQVLAPAAGRVVGMRVNAPGEVVPPREPLMEIVPEDEQLVVEARLPLDSIRHLRPEQHAELRFTAFNSRRTPLVHARLSYLSDDALSDSTGSAYYVVQLTPVPDSLRQAGIDALRPGMTAEIYLLTEERSTLEYLLTPVTDALRRSMREP